WLLARSPIPPTPIALRFRPIDTNYAIPRWCTLLTRMLVLGGSEIQPAGASLISRSEHPYLCLRLCRSSTWRPEHQNTQKRAAPTGCDRRSGLLPPSHGTCRYQTAEIAASVHWPHQLA